MMDKVSLLEYKNKQESMIYNTIDTGSPLASLINVQFNTTELCNRTCVFCPRTDPKVYPNRNLHISIETVDKISKDLASIQFKGKVSLSGFGEPLLHNMILDIIKTIKINLPESIVETNTNGDKLNPKVIEELYDSGIDRLYVNLYDGPKQVESFSDMFKNIDESKYIFRPHWNLEDNTYNLFLTNRGGTLNTNLIKKVGKPINQQCYLPFSTAMIDYNGDMVLCPNDWSRKYKIGSLLDNHIKDVWLGERMKNIRMKLANSDRSESPCNVCNINGMLSGKPSFDILMRYYENEI